jgi:hypothetical protein
VEIDRNQIDEKVCFWGVIGNMLSIVAVKRVLLVLLLRS